ncbi:MAG: hypothetical protein KJN76_07285, partial [Eudoraea sp.]|nr:hypothetical protein [Eudoraea sp.]
LVKIARKFDAQIRIVHISTKKDYAGDQQMEWFKDMVKEKVKYAKIDFNLILESSVFTGLDRYLKESDADLLAMLEREDKGLFSKLFHQDTVLKMEHQGKIPVLSYNIGGL